MIEMLPNKLSKQQMSAALSCAGESIVITDQEGVIHTIGNDSKIADPNETRS